MADIGEHDDTAERLNNLREALLSGAVNDATRLLRECHPTEIAILLESLPSDERHIIWSLVEAGRRGEVLTHVSDDVLLRLVHQLGIDELLEVTEQLDTDDLADILQELPEEVIQQILTAMDAQHRLRLEAVLSYPEDSAGGLMNVDAVTVRADITLDVVLRYLRWRGEIPENTNALIVVNRHNRYLGLLEVTSLLTQDPSLTVAEVLVRDVEGIPADTPTREVAKLFERRDLLSAPVVDEGGKLLGRITIDDVVDVIREEADHEIMSMAGLDEEEDLFAPVFASSRRRAVWLGLNLVTAFIASWVIGLFDATIEKLVALAILMPIVASMGGIAGSQTLTIVIRGMALGRVGSYNARRLMVKELLVALLNALIWALVIAAVAVAWFDSPPLGIVIGSAIVINLLIAALSGAVLPFLLRRLGIDPALAGSVVLTTITDVVGFFAFLGLATLFLV